MSCHKCGREINLEQFPLGLTFCPYCGDKISAHDPLQAISFCPYCGRRLLVAAPFCPECGKQIAAGTAVPHVAASATLPPYSDAPPSFRAHSQPWTETETDNGPQAVMAEPATVSSQPIWPKVVAICKRIWKPIGDLITGRWRLKRLYRDWSIHDALPPEEIPADDSLKNTPHRTSPPAKRIPLWVLIATAVGALIVFLVIGILIGRL